MQEQVAQKWDSVKRFYRLSTRWTKGAVRRVNRHTFTRDSVDTDVEKTSNCRTEYENKDPHICIGLSVVGSETFFSNFPKLDGLQEGVNCYRVSLTDS